MKKGKKSLTSTSSTVDFHANRTAYAGSENRKTTNVTSGPNARDWSEKLSRFGAFLKMYLESFPLSPTRFAKIWSAKTTASGFLITKLRLSAPRTGGCASSLWRTPKADDPNHGSVGHGAVQRKLEKGQTIRLQDQVNHPALFRTPDAGCYRGAQSPERFAESMEQGRLLTLNDQVAHLFPTPRAADGEKGPRTKAGAEKEANRGHGIDLPLFTQLYPTPTVRGNYNREGVSAHSGDGLATSVKKLYPTPTANDSKNNNPPSQHTENGRHSNPLNVVAGGALNPMWVEWLMGFPINWTDIGCQNLAHTTGSENGWWNVEPDIPRTAKKIPNRVARLRALGNAVVPMQAYPIFAAIAEIGGES